jgi:hypothetical protein
MSRSLSAPVATEIAKEEGAEPRSCCVLYLSGSTLRFTDNDDDLTFQGEVFYARQFSHSPIKSFFANKVDNCTISIDNTDLAMSAYYAADSFSGVRADVFKIFLARAGALTSAAVLKADGSIPYDGLSGTFPSAGIAYINGEKFTFTGNTGVALTGCSARLNGSADNSILHGAYPVDGDPATDDKILQFSGFMDTPKVTEQALSVRIVSMFDRAQSKSPWRVYTEKCNWDFCSAGYCTYNSASKVRSTADAGTTLSLTDNALAGISSMVGGMVKILAGTNKGAVRYLSAHNTVTGEITWAGALAAACDTSTQYVIECDKTKRTCSGFSNLANFGGFDDQVYLRGGVVRMKEDVSATGLAIPIIYGTAIVPGTLLDEEIVSTPVFGGVATGFYGDRIYGICEGEISSIVNFTVNGIMAYKDGVSQYTTTWGFNMGYTPYLGAAGQSFAFHGDTKYYPKTAVASISLLYGLGPFSWSLQDMESSGNNMAVLSLQMLALDNRFDKVVFTVKGLKVQKYNSDGTLDGAAAWSDNPVWCLLDFVMNRTLQKLTSSQIDFARCKAAADLCDALGYKLNLSLTEGTEETKILDWMLTACRGFITYSAGTMAVNVEGTGSAAKAFDMDSIVSDSFEGPFEAEINERPNRIIVTYIDQEIRQNVALINGDLAAADAVIPYADLRGTLTATGTVYIGADAVIYTGKTATELTGCSARSRAYRSGYPLFQGPQLFPQKTAIYNDWEDQENKKRVIDKAIDGRGVPTYDQAYRLAEYYGKKFVFGNVFCRFRGKMDSLALAIGDIATVTHDVPGWVAEEFRIIEASESQDEEVDYLCEVYDASFYEENTVDPGTVLVTTLPSPYAAPGHCTGLTLAEGGHVGQEGTYLPTITVTYTQPADDIFFSYAAVYVKVNAGGYGLYGNDFSLGEGFLVEGARGGFRKGDIVTVKVVAVNVRGLFADDATAPTDSLTIAASAVTIDAPANLVLEGGGTEWNGLKFAVTWDPPATGSEPAYNFFDVDVFTGGVLRQTFTPVKENRWEYIYGDGIAAGLDSFVVAANGAVTIKVKRKNVYGSASSQATLAITQAAPANPANSVIQALPRGAQMTWDKNQESDFKEYQVRTKVTAGGSWGSWIPIQDNTYARMLTAAEIAASGKTPAIYFEVKTVDLFGNASTATAANVAAIYYGITNLDVDDLSADKITAGSIRGINIQAGTFMTKGSYLTSAASLSDTTLNVKDTTDFAASGSGWILDSTNDKDAFSWTGKTDTTLTGCSGVKAHNNGAVVLPVDTSIIIDSRNNRMDIYNAGYATGPVASFDGDANGAKLRMNITGSADAIRGESALVVSVEPDLSAAGGLDPDPVSGIGVSVIPTDTSTTSPSFGIDSRCYPAAAGQKMYAGRFSIDDGLYVGGAPLIIIPAASASAPTHAAFSGSLWVSAAGVLYINTSSSSPGTTWSAVGTKLAFASSGTQNILAGANWTPAAGMYNISATNAAVVLVLYYGGVAHTGGVGVAGTVYFDGTNMYLTNTDGSSTHTVYWQKF